MRPSHDFKLAFIDLLLCSFVSIVVLFFMSTLLINPAKKVVTEGIKKNAEYVIQSEWDPNTDCDVDLWVRNPRGVTVYFKMKDAELMNLERDDFGAKNDSIAINGRLVQAQRNDEFITLRGYIPGEYTVNVHLYGCMFEGKQMNVGAAINVPVKVTLLKLNPTLMIANEKIVILKKVFDEETAFSFIMLENGTVSSYDDTPTKLVNVKRQSEGGN